MINYLILKPKVNDVRSIIIRNTYILGTFYLSLLKLMT